MEHYKLKNTIHNILIEMYETYIVLNILQEEEISQAIIDSKDNIILLIDEFYHIIVEKNENWEIVNFQVYDNCNIEYAKSKQEYMIEENKEKDTL